MSEVAKRDEDNRTQLVQRAYRLYVDGMSFEAIAKEISVHRNTASRYVREYANSQDSGTLHFQREVSRSKLRKMQAYIQDLIENGDIKDSSLTRPQLIHQWIEAEKEQNRIAGLHVNQVLVQENRGQVETAFELMKKAAEEGWIPQAEWEEIEREEGYADDDIEDAEVIDDEP